VAEPPTVALAGLVAEVGPVEAAQRVQDGRMSEALAGEPGARRSSGGPRPISTPLRPPAPC
jgi:DNA processing protein